MSWWCAARVVTVRTLPRARSGAVRAAFDVRSGDDREQPPAAGNALELVLAAVLEAQAGPRHEVGHGGRDADLAGARGSGHPGADVHGDPADVVADQLALAGVQPRPDLQAETGDRLADGGGPLDRARGPVEGGERTVARRLDDA